MNIIDQHIEKILKVYTEGDHYELLKKAKDEYIKLTGKLDEDDSEYESRMNSFNDWYIFHYRRTDDRRIIDDYIQDFKIDDELALAFHNVNYSLFHYVKINFKGNIVLEDILHAEKFQLKKEDNGLGLLEDDLFVGRLISYQGRNYLLKGVSTMPREVYGALKKQSKKLRKLNNNTLEQNFLLTLEKLKIKAINYAHINAEQIFVFN
jgi:hypothetical protein